MVLQSGLYTITTKEKGQPIGNTHSIGPSERKNALSLPHGTDAKWQITKEHDDSYTMRLQSNDTAAVNVDSQVFLEYPARHSNTWKIEPQFHQGENTHIILTADGSQDGWAASDDSRVLIKPLIMGPSVPPFFPPNELFVITPV
ncbi:hypothetical protein FA13DRAFT_1482904 [Coprinellus micaceus]|uniref:Ricin B lectin domain-containing protein n=1 Tax=Coprinellus micaceus TaxID=71717 RepID=A0A4Y7TJY3_COPMI|nr:hypothetical protein FA13DRAFT_1482904 [Coprinellus micaceus]